MKSIHTEIIIQASATKVWQKLMDFPNYPQWNPFIHIEGRAEVGQSLKNTIYLEGQKPQIFKPTVLEVQAERKFRWMGHLFFRGLFDGEHFFHLEAIDETQTRLIHGENFSGIFKGLILGMIKRQTIAGFEQMNLALKKLCES